MIRLSNCKGREVSAYCYEPRSTSGFRLSKTKVGYSARINVKQMKNPIKAVPVTVQIRLAL